MGTQKHSKLNWLHGNLPQGLMVDAAWLERHGFSRALRSKYVAHGWLEQVVRGVYRRPPAKILRAEAERHRIGWQEVITSLQTLLERPIAIGGRSALELQGFAHYLTTSGRREIHLYGYRQPPGWVSKLETEPRFVFHNAGKLFEEETTRIATVGKDMPQSAHTSLIRQTWGYGDWPITMSTPERAALELLDEIPQGETFHQVDVLMEGLRNLSPRRLHHLLVSCRSVKVKRLFLWFAERHNHAWLGRLDRTGIDLGHGKRMLVRGGKLDRKYNITVPEDFDAVR
ncbi:MAG: hypothetical protein EHM23_21725 [Acidobacteria bacterium]|nr:MAG: hypothetical protein EHM23_21725 [Acidobacteriota bacterium]